MTDAIERAIHTCQETLGFYKSGDDKKTPCEMGRIIGYEDCLREIKEAYKTHQSETVCVRVDELPYDYIESVKDVYGKIENAIEFDVMCAEPMDYVAALIAQKLQEKEERG